MCDNEDLHVLRQDHKLYLDEQKQIVQEVLFLKQWNFNQVITKIKDVYGDKIRNCEIEILESVYSKLGPPTLEKNTEMNGETLAKVLKEKPIYLRPSKQLIESYVPVGLPSKKKRFSSDDVLDVSSDSVSDGNGSDDDAQLERPVFATASL